MKNKHQYLVDGKYTFKDLVDIDRLREMFERFSQATGFTTGLVSYPDQELLICTGWRDICTKFHRAYPASQVHCKQSNLELTAHLKERRALNIRRCESGLVDGATPIIINGVHLANLATGQILFEEPDFELFRKQGEAYGYDVDAYLDALRKVPVVTEAEFKATLGFLCEMAVMLAEQGQMNLINLQSTRAARESEEKYRLLVENSAESIFVAQDGRLRFSNRKTQEIIGFSVDELTSRPFTDFIHPEDRALVYERHLQRLRGTELPSTYEFRVVRQSGEIRYVELKVVVIEWEGRPATLNFLGDITDRKQMESALRSERERFLTIAKSAPFGLVMIGHDGQYVYINPKFTEMFGYTHEEVPDGKTWFRKAFPDPDYRRQAISLWVHNQAVANVGVERPGTFTVQCKNGEKKVVKFIPVQLERGDNLVVCEDITERQQAEDALRESEERFRLTFKTSPDAVNINRFDDGLYVDINDGFTKLTGFTREDVIGKTALEINIWHNQDDRRKLAKGLRKNGYYENLEANFRRKDGSLTTALMSARVITLKGVPHIISVTQDISARKQAEAEKEKLQKQFLQAQKMEAIGTLAGGAAHDFNNLLQAIRGYTSLIIEGKNQDDPDYHRLMEIEKSVDRATQLVRQLLFFSRKAESERRPIEVNAEVEHARTLLERTIPKMIDIELKLCDHLWTILADPVQIEQTLLNLGSNAADAMPEGGRLVIETENITLGDEYTANNLDVSGNCVLLTVSDTGHGMDKETMAHIFEPFFTTKGIGKGTGLGLASVYGMVKSHRGQIKCYSELGKGTTFKIYFPAIEQGETKRIDAPVTASPKWGTETILIADDEISIIEITSDIIRSFGYKVLTALSGEEALATYATQIDKIDLVILDLGMPGIGGHRCLVELLKLDPSAKILIASGYSINGWVKNSLEAGAAGYIAKPYQLNDLLNKVRAVLDGKE